MITICQYFSNSLYWILIEYIAKSFKYVCTFFSCEFEVEINDVGAVLGTSIRAELLSEASIPQEIWWDPNSVPVSSTGFNTLITLNPVGLPPGLDLRGLARVFLVPRPSQPLLQYAACAWWWDSICAFAPVQALACNPSCWMQVKLIRLKSFSWNAIQILDYIHASWRDLMRPRHRREAWERETRRH